MPIGVQQEQIVAIDGHINRILDLRDLPAEEEVGAVDEGGILSGIDPDGTGRRIQHVQATAIVGKTGYTPPVAIRHGQGDGLPDLAW